MKTYVGIDPGKTGAVAIISDHFLVDRNRLSEVYFYDAEKGVNFNDLAKAIVGINFNEDCFVLLEKAQVMPRKRKRMVGGQEIEESAGQGSVGMLNYGIGYGEYRGMLKALLIPFAEIHPMTWKKEFGLVHQDKDRSIQVARQLFPSVDDMLTRKKDHGRAEALLIAEYARRRNM
jgi:hypothetical protein